MHNDLFLTNIFLWAEIKKNKVDSSIEVHVDVMKLYGAWMYDYTHY
jgi:hypothetical protein